MKKRGLDLRDSIPDVMSPKHVNEHSPSPGLPTRASGNQNFRMKYYSAIETGERHLATKEKFDELP